MSEYIGIHFARDNASAIAKISLYNSTRSEYVFQDREIDLYQADQDYSLGEYEDFIYWATVPYPSENYDLTSVHSGSHNPSAVSPYHIQILEYVSEKEINAPTTIHTVKQWNDIGGIIHSIDYTLHDGEVTETYKTQSFNGDGVTTDFTLQSGTFADRPYQFSNDGGTTWLWPNSYHLTWGSEGTDNETTEDAKFTVSFVVPPDTGVNNVLIKYVPLATHYMITRNLIKKEEEGYIDNTIIPRLLDDGIEVIY